MGMGNDAPAPEGVVSPAKTTAESAESPRLWEEELGQVAYQRGTKEMLELPNEKVMVVNLNLTETIAVGLGVLPNVRALRESMPKFVLDCRFDWIDALEDYILALNYARAAYLTVTRPKRCAPEVWLEARHVRRVLMHDWRALAARGLLDHSLLRGLQRGKGYLELGSDLTALAHVHRAYAASSGAALPPEVERASLLARSILTAGGRPNPKSAAVIEARDMQNRNFTLFVRAYNETRHVIIYMRRNDGDADRIIPSLYAARKARAGAHPARKAITHRRLKSPSPGSVPRRAP